ncbi:MAG TPA: cupin domain-containing protein [Parvibaculum sp.]|jgi:quercetin dioxygenase-like cupin family protein
MKIRFSRLSARLLAPAALLIAATMAAYLTQAEAHMPGESVAPAFNQMIPNIPGKSLIGAVVEYAPGAKSVSHHHAKSAFILAYVLSGAIRSQLNDGKVQVFHAGESWSEVPGTHHTISENASDTEPAKLLAIFVVDSADKALTVNDKKD